MLLECRRRASGRVAAVFDQCSTAHWWSETSGCSVTSERSRPFPLYFPRVRLRANCPNSVPARLQPRGAQAITATTATNNINATNHNNNNATMSSGGNATGTPPLPAVVGLDPAAAGAAAAAAPARGRIVPHLVDPPVLPYRCVRGQPDWNVDVPRGHRVLVALRVWTKGARLSQLAVHLKAHKVKAGARFAPTPPWLQLSKITRHRRQGGSNSGRYQHPTPNPNANPSPEPADAAAAEAAAAAKHAVSVQAATAHDDAASNFRQAWHVNPAAMAMAKEGRTVLIGGGVKAPLEAVEAPGPGYFIVELNNKFNVIRNKHITSLDWRIDGDDDAPCYAIGTIPLTPLGDNTNGGVRSGGGEPVAAEADDGRSPTCELPLAEAQCVCFLRAAAELDPALLANVSPGGVPLRHDTETLLRFARGFNLRPKASLAALQKYATWRATLPAPGSIPEVQEEKKLRRIYFHGRVDGPSRRRLMIVEAARFLDNSTEDFDPATVAQAAVELIDSAGEEDTQHLWTTRGRQPASYAAFLDMTGGDGWPRLSFVKVISNVFNGNYPGRAGAAVVYPVPAWVRRVIEGLMHLFVDKVTRAKVHFATDLAVACKSVDIEDAAAVLPEAITDPKAVAKQVAFLREREAEQAKEAARVAALEQSSGQLRAVDDATENDDGDDDEDEDLLSGTPAMQAGVLAQAADE